MQIQSLSINKNQIISLIQFCFLMAVAAIAPLFHFQPITGPIVNATLFLAASFMGAQNAIMVGLLPSLIALSVGLLPAPLAPMVPFIMVSNAILILAFAYLKKKNFWLAVVASSGLKFLFLSSTSLIVSHLIIKKEIAQKAVLMMGWPQLLTALGGGILAFLLLKYFDKKSI